MRFIRLTLTYPVKGCVEVVAEDVVALYSYNSRGDADMVVTAVLLKNSCTIYVTESVDEVKKAVIDCLKNLGKL